MQAVPLTPVPQPSEQPSISSPLLGRWLAGPLLFLFQPPPGFLQLGQWIGCRVGGHGGVLNEGMGRLHHIAQLGADPGVHSDRALDGDRAGQVVRQLLLSAGRALGKGKQREKHSHSTIWGSLPPPGRGSPTPLPSFGQCQWCPWYGHQRATGVALNLRGQGDLSP